MEYERLIAYFDGDATGINKAGAEALKVADSVEARFKNLKAEVEITVKGNGGSSVAPEILNAEKQLTREVKIESENQAKAKKSESQNAADSLIRDLLRVADATDSAFNKIVNSENLAASARKHIESNYVNLTLDEQKRLTAETIKEVERRAKEEAKTLTSNNRTKTGSDPEAAKAEANQKRLDAASRKRDADYTNFVTSQAEKQYQARIKQWQRGADEFQKILDKEKKAEAQSTKSGGGGGGSFLTTASEIGNVVSGIRNGISIVEGFASTVTSTAESFLNLIKNASDYGREIGTVETKTGLAANTISALRYAANLSGKELTDLQRPLAIFSILLGNAEKGSKSAQEKLKALGVTDFKNLDQSLSQVFARIEALPPGLERMNAAADAFGKRAGVDLIPVIDKMGGNLTEATRRAEELGLVLSDSDLQAARDFNVYYTTVSAQIEALGSKFLLELAPDVSDGLESVSNSLSKNQNEIAVYGQAFSIMIKGVISDTESVVSFIENHSTALRVLAGIGTLGQSEIIGSIFDTGTTIVADNLVGAAGGVPNKSNYKELSNAETQKKIAAENADTGSKFGLDPTGYLDEFGDGADKAAIKALEDSSKKAIDILKNRYAAEKSLRDLANRFTTEDELNFARAEGAARTGEIQSEIAERTGYFDKLIALNAGNSEKQQAAEGEKATVLSNLNKDLETNEYETQKKIQNYENKIYEERRQAAIQFKQLQIQDAESNLSAKSFDINEGLSTGIIPAATGFDQLKTLTQTSYEEIRSIIRASYEKQFEDLTLTAEQRTNLTQKMYLDEANLAEKNREEIIKIEDDKRAALIAKLQKYQSQLEEEYAQDTQFFQTVGENFKNTFSSFGTPDFQNVTKFLKQDIGETVAELKKANGAVDDFNKSLSQKGADSTFLTEGLKNVTLVRDALASVVLQKQEAYKILSKAADDIIGGASLDKVNLDIIKGEEESSKQIIETQKQSVYKQIQEAKSGTAERADLEHQMTLLFQKEANTRAAFAQKEDEAYLNSTAALRSYLNLLRTGDTVAVRIASGDAEKKRLSDEIGLAQENIALEEKLAHAGEDAADRYRNAWLKATADVVDADTKAHETLIAAQVKYADFVNKSLSINNDEIQTKVLGVLASQKTLSDIVGDAQAGALTDAFAGVDSGVHSLAKSLGIADTAAGHFFETMVGGLAKLALDKVFGKLFNFSTADGGGSLGEIFGLPTNLSGGKKADAETLLTGASSSRDTAIDATLGALSDSSQMTTTSLLNTADSSDMLDLAMKKLAVTCEKGAAECGCGGSQTAETTGGHSGLASFLNFAISAAGAVFGGSLGGGGSSGGGGFKAGGQIGGARALGGPVESGKTYLTGERGPELFFAGRSGTILNHQDSEEILAGRKSGQTIINQTNTINQTIHAPRGTVPAKSARQMAQHTIAGISSATK